MLSKAITVQLALCCIAGVTHAQGSAGSVSRTTYGNNALSVDFDNEAISRNYQDVDIKLLSPAFLNPESVPAGFNNGTSGPTPLHELGMQSWNMMATHSTQG
jgi:hypothetical protein